MASSVYIQHEQSQLVLDGREEAVKLSPNYRSPTQTWTLISLHNGKFIIRNNGNGNVLDIRGGPGCNKDLITYQQHGQVNQQWFVNSDGTIVSAAGNFALDIPANRFSPGVGVITWTKHGQSNQIFKLVAAGPSHPY